MPAQPNSTSQGGEPAAPGVTIVTGGSAPAPVSVSNQERDEFVTRLIGHHGTAAAALTKLAGEQLKFRRRAQRAEAQVKELQGKLPTDGSVVLTGDEAKAYNEIKSKGLTLDKVPAQLNDLVELRKTVSTRTREEDLKEAAGKKYDRSVLTKLLGDTPLEFQNVNVMKEDKSGIDTIKKPYVVIKNGDKETREDLDTFVEREFKPFMEVLKAKDSTEEGTSSSTESGSTGGTMPKQSSASSGPTNKNAPAAIKVVDKTLSTFMTPSQRRKESAGGA